MAKTIIGVMGPGGGAGSDDKELAFELGSEIARNGWVLLTGGRNAGVMHAASRGAKSSGGLTVGILPAHNLEGISEFVDIPVRTGMGNARNNINILSSDVVIACGAGLGTVSEIVLAIKSLKPVVLLNQSPSTLQMLSELTQHELKTASTAEEAVRLVQNILGNA